MEKYAKVVDTFDDSGTKWVVFWFWDDPHSESMVLEYEKGTPVKAGMIVRLREDSGAYDGTYVALDDLPTKIKQLLDPIERETASALHKKIVAGQLRLSTHRQLAADI